MFSFGKTPCALCFRRVSPSGAVRSSGRAGIVVCRACYEQWDGAGRRCGQCGMTVQPQQQVSVFLKPQGAFGHAECGGIRMADQ